MSTVEDFENAPVGATAEDGKWVKFRPTNNYCSEWVEVLAPSNPETEGASRSNRDMFYGGYTLDPSPVTPTTAREALALAWELSHPVKVGQVIPAGTRHFWWPGTGGLSPNTTMNEREADEREAKYMRTLDPLPEPVPDWLDAPAVIAFVKGQVSRVDPQVFARANKTGNQGPHDGYWRSSLTGLHYHWTYLIDVIPLWPKETSDD